MKKSLVVSIALLGMLGLGACDTTKPKRSPVIVEKTIPMTVTIPTQVVPVPKPPKATVKVPTPTLKRP